MIFYKSKTAGSTERRALKLFISLQGLLPFLLSSFPSEEEKDHGWSQNEPALPQKHGWGDRLVGALAGGGGFLMAGEAQRGFGACG